jgi:MoxR-like ATPase
VASAQAPDPGRGRGEAPQPDSEGLNRAGALGEALIANVNRVLVGKNDQVNLAVVCLLARGHALIEDVPGVGKTTLAKAVARSIGGRFDRIQFTPDLLPSDVVGINMYDPDKGGFQFRPGPVFANVLLADEINRATPKTQSALLESMEERQVTLDGVTHPLYAPFIVLATQNPIEFAGTHQLGVPNPPRRGRDAGTIRGLQSAGRSKGGRRRGRGSRRAAGRRHRRRGGRGQGVHRSAGGLEPRPS